MKAKELLYAAFSGCVFKGKAIEQIVNTISDGSIKPNKTYIQTFDKLRFFPYNPDVTFITNSGQKCYLYEVN